MLKALRPWLRRAWEFVRWTGDALHAADIAGWVWDRVGESLHGWSGPVVGAIVTGGVGAIGWMADAPLVVVAALYLVLLAALIAAGSWSHRREREHERQDAMIEQRVTEAVAALPDSVKRQPAERGITVGEWILRLTANVQRQRKAGADPDPDA